MKQVLPFSLEPIQNKDGTTKQDGTQAADDVNYSQFKIINKAGKTTYKNSWVTDIHITKKNIGDLVKGGRARWKIENETFNILKNQGYHLSQILRF